MWKESLILILFLILASLPIFAAETCQSAVPRYGQIQCKKTGNIETISGSLFTRSGNELVSQIPCLSNCKLDSSSLIKDPSGKSLGQDSDFCDYLDNLEIAMSRPDGYSFTENEIESINSKFPIEFNRDTPLTIRLYCRQPITNTKTNNIKNGSSISSYKQDEIKLYEGWAGSLPESPISGTEGCRYNSVEEKYKQRVNSYLDPTTDNIQTIPAGTYSSMPSGVNWKNDENYIFVKDWQTGIADISFTYDKQNNVYWCGGLSGSRKIYNVNKITSASGACYAIPLSIYLQNIECCFPADCSWKGTKYTCNPDTWKCEETRWCDSQLECDQVFGSGVCQNKQITSWVCNTNKKWGTHAGTCEKSIRTVQQCPSDCTASEYYNEEEGICKSRVTILDCPAGKCCNGGGNYKPKNCTSELVCCPTADPIIGECKASCAPPPQTTQQQNKTQEMGNLAAESSATPQPIDAGSILAIVSVIAVGGGASYFLFLKKPKIPTTPVSKKVSEKFCTKCGASMKAGKGFCTKCGKRVK